ncbi:MAG: arsenite methyltransferase [Anaerolineaceae bacterium]
MAKNQKEINIHRHVRQRYGEIAQSSTPEKINRCGCLPESGNPFSCCSPTDSNVQQIASSLYSIEDIQILPNDITDLSLGCGDPVTLADLRPSQTVLDLGAGGGIDCFLAGKKVGPTGRVIGVDMTPEMLEKARSNKEKMGADNVEFRLGEIEHLPVADNSVDVIISNCVINLSPDKPQVFREAFRVLKPGGKLAVTDIVTNGPLPENIRNSLDEWAACVAGALDVQDYISGLEAAGFEHIEAGPVLFDPVNTNQTATKKEDKPDNPSLPLEDLSKKIYSAKITARKP